MWNLAAIQCYKLWKPLGKSLCSRIFSDPDCALKANLPGAASTPPPCQKLSLSLCIFTVPTEGFWPPTWVSLRLGLGAHSSFSWIGSWSSPRAWWRGSALIYLSAGILPVLPPCLAGPRLTQLNWIARRRPCPKSLLREPAWETEEQCFSLRFRATEEKSTYSLLPALLTSFDVTIERATLSSKDC